MSVEVDDVWLYELILTYLKKIEEDCPPLVRESPHFLNGDRRIIVQWINKLSKTFKIGIEAHHLAVFLFDYFIAEHQADSQGLYLIGSACFSVACKVNDVETNVPQASKILKLAPFENVMQSYLLKSTEILILQHFNWNVLKPTEASFLEYYAASCLAIELECVDNHIYSTNLSKYYNKWITFYREIILYNDEFRDHKPSQVACSVVIATRISIGLIPVWPDFMVHLTGWYQPDVANIVTQLTKLSKLELSNQPDFDYYKLPNDSYEFKCQENFYNGDNEMDIIYNKLLKPDDLVTAASQHKPLYNGDMSNNEVYEDSVNTYFSPGHYLDEILGRDSQRSSELRSSSTNLMSGSQYSGLPLTHYYPLPNQQVLLPYQKFTATTSSSDNSCSHANSSQHNSDNACCFTAIPFEGYHPCPGYFPFQQDGGSNQLNMHTLAAEAATETTSPQSEPSYCSSMVLLLQSANYQTNAIDEYPMSSSRTINLNSHKDPLHIVNNTSNAYLNRNNCNMKKLPIPGGFVINVSGSGSTRSNQSNFSFNAGTNTNL